MHGRNTVPLSKLGLTTATELLDAAVANPATRKAGPRRLEVMKLPPPCEVYYGIFPLGLLNVVFVPFARFLSDA